MLDKNQNVFQTLIPTLLYPCKILFGLVQSILSQCKKLSDNSVPMQNFKKLYREDPTLFCLLRIYV